MKYNRFFCDHPFPASVVLWGAGALQRYVQGLLNTAGIKIEQIVDRYSFRHDTLPECLSVEKWQSSGLAAGDTPIIVTAENSSGELVFAEVFDWLNDRYPERRVLHPASVYAWGNVSYEGLFLLNGYPSSGNRVWTSILVDLLAMREKQSAVPDINRARLSRNLDSWIEQRLASVLKAIGVNSEVVYNRALHVGANYLEIGDERSYVSVDPIPCLELFYRGFRPGHFKRHRSEWDWLLERGAKGIFISRHPLDTVVSLAAKFWYMDQIRGLVDSKRDIKELRRAVSWFRLGDEEWFKKTLIACVELVEGFISGSELEFVGRYEELLHDPKTQIVGLARHIGLDLSESEAERLWDIYGMKPLGAYKVHFNDPSVSKWKSALSDIHVEWIVGALGSEWKWRFERMGYPVDLGEISGKRCSSEDFDDAILDEALSVLNNVDSRSNSIKLMCNNRKVWAQVFEMNAEQMPALIELPRMRSIRKWFAALWGWGDEAGFDGSLCSVASDLEQEFNKPCNPEQALRYGSDLNHS